jgi:hypothetical protein
MKNLFTSLIVMIILSACNGINQNGQSVDNSPSEVCINGVVYYARGHGIAVALNSESKVILCDGNSIN